MSKIEELVAAEMAEYYDGAYADSGCAKDQLRTLIRKVVIDCAGVCTTAAESNDILSRYGISYAEATQVWMKA